MTKTTVAKPNDTIQERLATYAWDLSYEKLPPEAIRAAKLRVIDTLAALMGGYFENINRVGRKMAADMPSPRGATIIGTRTRTLPDIAAFVNATAARCVEMNDSYHWPGSKGGHPSDVVLPILAAAEYSGANGRDFITGIVLGYEVFCRISNEFRHASFDPTIFGCLAVAMASAKLMRLSHEQLCHCISIAVVNNNILRQVRKDSATMFKSAASGYAGKAGVFAAMLAGYGMEGPDLPVEGKAGWCDNVAMQRFKLDTLGGAGTRFKVLDAHVKYRASCGTAISSVLAAEKVAPVNIKDVKQVTVEVYKDAKERCGTGAHRWDPHSRESADHSIPYNVAITLTEGTVSPRSFNEAHLANAELRSFLHKIEVVENEEFTKLYSRTPVEHHTKITVVMNSGEKLVGKTGGDKDDMGAHKEDEAADIEHKFRSVTEEIFGTSHVNMMLEHLWHMEDMQDVSAIPADFTLD